MVAKDLKESLEAQLVAQVGVNYKPLKYIEDPSLNSFTQGNDRRYGVRPGGAPENVVAGVKGAITYTQTFEFVLTKGFVQDGVSDSAAYEAWLELHDLALLYNSRLINTKAGMPTVVLNVLGFNLAPPEFLEDKVAVLTGSVDIIYRINL